MSEIPEPLFFFVFQIMPYIMYIVFIFGLIIRVSEWASVTRGGTNIFSEVIPPRSGWIQTLSQFIYLIVFQGRFVKKKLSSIILWLMSWLMHITLFFVVFGHFRAVGVWSAEQFTWLMPREFMVTTLPLLVGVLLMVMIVLLALRRLIDPTSRAISTWSDYAILILFFIHVLTGNMMRFLPHDHAPLKVILSPSIIMSLEDTPPLYWLALHTATAQLFIMLLPFSKVIHVIGGVVTMWMSSVRYARLAKKVG